MNRPLGIGVVASLSACLVLAAPSSARAEGPAPANSTQPPKDPNVPYPPPARILSPPKQPYSYAEPQIRPTLPWLLFQLVPSPQLGIGTSRRIGLDGSAQQETNVAFGLRWELTPVSWSWGLHRRVSPWRFFVVDPLARHSGSIEADLTFDYFLGHVGRVLVRPGIRGTFPLFHRGEYLSMSFGTSAYLYDDIPRLAYDVGAYVLFGLFGVQATIAPVHEPLKAIATFRIRYF